MSTKQILIDAKALIDTPDKWWQCLPDGEIKIIAKGATCAGNAIACAAKSLGETLLCYKSAFPLFCAAINKTRIGEIHKWNDHPDRTHAEVMQAFDRAIQLADES